IEVERSQTLQANQLVKFGERAFIAFSCAEIIPGGKGVLGIETKPQAVAVANLIKDLTHVGKAIAQTRPLPSGDFERDAGVKTSARCVHCINGTGYVRYAHLFARSHVGAGIRYKGSIHDCFVALYHVNYVLSGV